jgi:hypothetical protein
MPQPARSIDGWERAVDVQQRWGERPVVVVRIVETAVGHLNVGAGGGIEVGEIPVLFLNDAE